MIGETISHYRIVEKLGSGGMGIVYKAFDLKLGRAVALKFLTEHLARDPEAVQRFEREARASSALNDPGICTIYEIEEVDGSLFIAMELLEGESLSAALSRGALPFPTVLDYGLQIVEALGAAHGKGICHRDIKPANIFIVRAGRAKILDFGLAKIEEGFDSQLATNVPQWLTKPGTVAGTALYMSPEQALGQPLDQRTDIFSVGLVLYEMSTGARAFSGTIAAVHDAILNRQPPPPSTLSPGLPPEFDRVIARAIRKDVRDRYQTASEMLADLKRIKQAADLEQSRASMPALQRPAIGLLPAAVAFGLIAVTAVLAYVLLGRSSTNPSRPFLADATFAQVTDQPGLEASASLAPDGKSVVYASRASGSWHIYLQRTDSKSPSDLTPDSPVDNVDPAYSPDGKQVAFRSERDGGGIFVLDVASKAVQRVSNFCHNPAWSPDHKSIACAIERIDVPTSRLAVSQLWILDLASGGKRQLTVTDGVQPSWSPHGDRIAYWSFGQQGGLWTIPAGDGPPVPVPVDGPTTWNPVWSPDGQYLFFSSNRGGSTNLWRIPIEEKSGRVLGPIEPVTTPSSNAGFISIAHDGSRIAYVHQTFAHNFSKVRFDRPNDAAVPVTEGAHIYRQLDVSPSGEFLTYQSDSRIFVMSVDGTGPRQLTDSGSARGPRWSPDGATIAFYLNRKEPITQIWTIKPDGTGMKQITDYRTAGSKGLYYPVWFPDGKHITCTTFEGVTLTFDLSKPEPDHEPVALPPLPTPGQSFVAWRWSLDGSALSGWKLLPDGRSAGIAVYDARAHRYTELTSGGVFPAWIEQGRTLLYAAGDALYRVGVESRLVAKVTTLPRFFSTFSLAKDGRWLYYEEEQREGDVWLINLRPSSAAR
jgi:eukaryotic-like serine/threonine-protein kinase